MRAGSLIAAGWLLAAGAVLATGLAWGETPGGIAAGYVGSSLAEAIGFLACAAAAVHTRDRARTVWALFAAGQLVWALTDGAYAAVVLAGHAPEEVSLFDAGWLLFYVPMLAGVVLLYRRLRPERGWQGLIDGLIVSVAGAAFGWVLVIHPAAAQASGGVTGTLVDLLYPVVDVTSLVAVGWMVLRHRGRTPSWLRWVAAAFALQAAGGLAYVGWTLEVGGLDAASSALFVVAGGAWAAAARSRRAVEARTWVVGTHDAPPVWSQRVTFLIGLGVVALAAVRPEPELRIAAVVITAFVAVRAIDALNVHRGLLAERDRLLVIDPLTGAYNRRHLETELAVALARADRAGEPVSAIALDLDGFKGVNDRLGHGVGDALLAAVATCTGAELRIGDLLCRLGGDEFLVLCPGADGDGASELAERIRAAVAAAGDELVPGGQVTVSAGVATFPADADDGHGLLRTADVALYAAKASGRDRVVRHVDVTAPAAR